MEGEYASFWWRSTSFGYCPRSGCNRYHPHRMRTEKLKRRCLCKQHSSSIDGLCCNGRVTTSANEDEPERPDERCNSRFLWQRCPKTNTHKYTYKTKQDSHRRRRLTAVNCRCAPLSVQAPNDIHQPLSTVPLSLSLNDAQVNLTPHCCCRGWERTERVRCCCRRPRQRRCPHAVAPSPRRSTAERAPAW
jgi:hypothetical protein